MNIADDGIQFQDEQKLRLSTQLLM